MLLDHSLPYGQFRICIHNRDLHHANSWVTWHRTGQGPHRMIWTKLKLTILSEDDCRQHVDSFGNRLMIWSHQCLKGYEVVAEHRATMVTEHTRLTTVQPTTESLCRPCGEQAQSWMFGTVHEPRNGANLAEHQVGWFVTFARQSRPSGAQQGGSSGGSWKQRHLNQNWRSAVQVAHGDTVCAFRCLRCTRAQNDGMLQMFVFRFWY